jgi:hypothetical protein
MNERMNPCARTYRLHPPATKARDACAILKKQKQIFFFGVSKAPSINFERHFDIDDAPVLSHKHTHPSNSQPVLVLISLPSPQVSPSPVPLSVYEVFTSFGLIY